MKLAWSGLALLLATILLLLLRGCFQGNSLEDVSKAEYRFAYVVVKKQGSVPADFKLKGSAEQRSAQTQKILKEQIPAVWGEGRTVEGPCLASTSSAIENALAEKHPGYVFKVLASGSEAINVRGNAQAKFKVKLLSVTGVLLSKVRIDRNFSTGEGEVYCEGKTFNTYASEQSHTMPLTQVPLNALFTNKTVHVATEGCGILLESLVYNTDR